MLLYPVCVWPLAMRAGPPGVGPGWPCVCRLAVRVLVPRLPRACVRPWLPGALASPAMRADPLRFAEFDVAFARFFGIKLCKTLGVGVGFVVSGTKQSGLLSKRVWGIQGPRHLRDTRPTVGD